MSESSNTRLKNGIKFKMALWKRKCVKSGSREHFGGFLLNNIKYLRALYEEGPIKQLLSPPSLCAPHQFIHYEHIKIHASYSFLLLSAPLCDNNTSWKQHGHLSFRLCVFHVYLNVASSRSNQVGRCYFVPLLGSNLSSVSGESSAHI